MNSLADSNPIMSSSVAPTPAGGGRPSDGTRQTVSHGLRSGSRLVARMRTPGHQRSNTSATRAAASMTCPVTASLTLSPRPSDISCPPGQSLELASVSYINVTLTDTTNNISIVIGTLSLGAFSRTCAGRASGEDSTTAHLDAPSGVVWYSNPSCVRSHPAGQLRGHQVLRPAPGHKHGMPSTRMI